jgi:large subunit ribosomal protein L21
MYAIFTTGGKQYRAQVGDVIFVEKLNANENEQVVFDQVLMADGKIGTPTLEGAKVLGTVEKNGRGKKIIVFKMKSKKNYRKKQGHRQAYTKVVITDIVC